MTKNLRILTALFLFSMLTAACQSNGRSALPEIAGAQTAAQTPLQTRAVAQNTAREVKLMLDSLTEQTRTTTGYDPAYVVLPYPNGDVSPATGVCTDVVIRALRAAGVDLQKEVHEDMKQNFAVYPQKWRLKKADSNIDHRRVPNLGKFFERRHKSLTITNKSEDYQPGDVVSWDLDGNGLTHIGMVSNRYSEQTKRFLIIHNIGRGAQAEDILFEWKITGHFRYF